MDVKQQIQTHAKGEGTGRGRMDCPDGWGRWFLSAFWELLILGATFLISFYFFFRQLAEYGW